jgi:hypothetical protein
MATQFDDLIRRYNPELQRPERRKCFISYYHGDQDAVNDFVETFDDVIIAKAIGAMASY